MRTRFHNPGGIGRNMLASAALFLSFFVPQYAVAQQSALPSVKLSAGIHLIQAEVAKEMMTRAQGLMHRKEMPQGSGMLFIFDEQSAHCMWMKNTLIPLSVAFIDEQGAIVNIADMQPLDETSHCATRPARYALEMNQGWFAKRGLLPGTPIKGLPRPLVSR